MGISIAVCCADFVFLLLEADAVACPGVRFYKRYIDDIFAITTVDCQVFEFFNSKCPDIQLDAITIGPSAVFLDLTVTINNDQTISTTIKQSTTWCGRYSTWQTGETSASQDGKHDIAHMFMAQQQQQQALLAQQAQQQQRAMLAQQA